MKCVKCGTEMKEGTKFCGVCGTPVVQPEQQNENVPMQTVEPEKEAEKAPEKAAEEEPKKEPEKAAEEEPKKEPAKAAEEEPKKEPAKVPEEEPKKEPAKEPEKEPKKKSKVPVILVIILLLIGLGTGGYFVWKNIGEKPAKETSQESSKEDGEKEKETDDKEESEKETEKDPEPTKDPEQEAKENAEKKKAEDIAKILSEAESLASAGKYSEAILKLQTGLTVYPEEEASLQAKIDEYNVGLAEQKKQNLLNEASTYALNGDYAAALQLMIDAQKESPSDQDYEERYLSYSALYQDSALLEAEGLATAEDYAGAFAVVDKALELIGENETLLLAHKNYFDLKNAPLIEAALTEAETLAQGGDYLAALQRVNLARTEIGETEKFTAAAQIYEDAYVDEYIKQVTDCLSSADVAAAKEMIAQAPVEIAGNAKLAEVQGNIENYKVTYLNQMDVFYSSGWENYSDTVADTIGTDYSMISNYMVWNKGYNDTDIVQYRVNYEYNNFSMTVAPWSGVSAGATSHIIVYVNDDVRYITPAITYSTKPFEINVDICDAEYISIRFISDNTGGTVLMTDMKCSYMGLPTGPVEKDYVAFDKFEVLNGGFNFEDDLPKDSWNTEYCDVINYAVISSYGTVSREVFIGGEYASFSMDIACYGGNASTVKVYADDKQVYSTTVNQKTKKFNTGDIDMTGVNFVKVSVSDGGPTSVILSNMILKKAPAEATDTETTPAGASDVQTAPAEE